MVSCIQIRLASSSHNIPRLERVPSDPGGGLITNVQTRLRWASGHLGRIDQVDMDLESKVALPLIAQTGIHCDTKL